jgi:hypothetical protein
MKYFTNKQIQESLKNLEPYNAFFSTTFLVLKKLSSPVGSKKRIKLDAENKKFLQDHFQIHPKSNYFFRVMRQNANKKDWVEPDYASTGLQAINTQTFRDALLHEKNDNIWGWTEDYVKQLAIKLPHKGVRIPLFNLAVWLYKYRGWEESTHRKDVVNTFIKEFNLSDTELLYIFQTDIVSDIDENQTFQEVPVKWNEILAPFSQPKDIPTEASGILTYLETEGIGPVSKLVFQPSKRLNLITGDNGLGKTFLLDLSWWALTQDWAERPATPFDDSTISQPFIKFSVGNVNTPIPIRAIYSNKTGSWEIRQQRAALSGLVVFARLDGSFAIWDPANRILSSPSIGITGWPGVKYSRDDVWDGKPGQIEGLIRDWTRWQQRPDKYSAFTTFQSVLKRVSPPDLGPLTAGEPVRIINDPREIPTLKHSYGNVPIVFESAGIRRILTLAYLLVWAWEEHKVQARQQGKPEEHQMVVLIDEAEAHLHPKWQRVILPALLQVAHELSTEMSIQWIIASHSPLVLASGETIWDTESDSLFHINLNMSGKVMFEKLDFEKRGTVDSWLSSNIFEIKQPGSTERESAINEALLLQQKSKPSKDEVQAVTNHLKEYLPTEDPFWVRWIFFAESFGVTL